MDINAARLEAVLNTVIDGIITIDDMGIIKSFNPSAVRIFGYKPDEVIDKNVKVLMPDPYQKEHDSYIANYKNTGEKKVIGIGREVAARRKNGQIFPMELGINEMNISGKRMFVGTIRDISDRKKAEQALKDSQAKLEAIVDNTVDGLITIDELGHIETFNKSCQRIFGYKSDEVVGQNVKVLMPEPYHKEHDGYLKHYKSTGEKKIIGIGREVRGKRKNGTIFPLDLSISEVNIEGRKIYSGIVRDISDRKKAEDEIIRSNEELERFAYIASHDLQEPLRLITNFTNLLFDEYQDSFDDQAAQYMNFIMDASRRMQDLVGDLLEYSRIGHEDAGFSEFDSKVFTELALNNLRESITETNAEISIGNLPVIYAKPIRFTRLIQNLVVNAIKYRKKEIAPKIEINVKETKDAWLYSVSDNGIGIKNEYLEQIFIIFKRLHGKSEYQGTGIGLAVCKKIVESFEGKIWAESEFGKGSVFYFTVPKKQNAEPQ